MKTRILITGVALTSIATLTTIGLLNDTKDTTTYESKELPVMVKETEVKWVGPEAPKPVEVADSTTITTKVKEMQEVRMEPVAPVYPTYDELVAQYGYGQKMQIMADALRQTKPESFAPEKIESTFARMDGYFKGVPEGWYAQTYAKMLYEWR